MSFDFSYMGTKKRLAPIVAAVIAELKPGIALDLFSGMCAIGEKLAPDRQVWNNDVQLFAATVARALFTSDEQCVSPVLAAELTYASYYRHVISLRAINH